jgi:hypothetical protein
VVILGKHISDRLLSQVIFHLVFWSGWILFPFIAGPDNPEFKRFAVVLIPNVLFHIPFFFLNSNWLIPSIFRKRGIGQYIVGLLLLTIVATAFLTAMRELIFPIEFIRNHWDFSWSLLGVLFSTGVSTGYGFVIYLSARERSLRDAHEEQLKSELSFLRSQISPHFIFNILNGLVYLIRNNREEAEDTAIRLSGLMRYMLYESGDKQVTIEKEIEYLQNYIELQRLRFGEDVDIQVSIDLDQETYWIEPMLIIPFVENAFKHGTGFITDPQILVTVMVENGLLTLKVSNRISSSDQEAKDPSSGIGLKNVTRRIELLYPNDHQLNISSFDGWFEVDLELKIDSNGGKGIVQ